MIYRKSLIKEVTYTAIGIFIVLFVILVSTQSINLLGRATEGRVAMDAVFALIGFWALSLSPVLLILTVFVGLLTVFTRYWRDSEMAVWLSCGLSLRSWIRPVFSFAIPFAIVVGLVSTLVTPWAAQRSREYAENLKQREELSVVAPGVFKEVGKQKRVYFVEKFSAQTGAAENIFVQDVTEDGRNTVIFAKTGYLLVENGERKLVLENGHRYTGNAGEANFEELAFQKFSAAVSYAPKFIDPDDDRRTTPTRTLIHTSKPELKAELMWRLSMPISVLILALLSIPLSYYNPRAGHTYNLFFALVVYLVYQNGLTLLRNMIAEGKISMIAGFLIGHLAMLCLAFILIRYRSLAAGPFWTNLKTTFTFKS
ncbi:LPS export ABC transporter permease LptF [Neisseria sp. Ec49-e6-T10]|uniref:LPS export ABC transporter permease LptF n=1 Tax=Neisseria sp. Ec49-e6-T10 TaxID=3140744 RepID=UPI003EBADDC0